MPPALPGDRYLTAKPDAKLKAVELIVPVTVAEPDDSLVELEQLASNPSAATATANVSPSILFMATNSFEPK